MRRHSGKNFFALSAADHVDFENDGFFFERFADKGFGCAVEVAEMLVVFEELAPIGAAQKFFPRQKEIFSSVPFPLARRAGGAGNGRRDVPPLF